MSREYSPTPIQDLQFMLQQLHARDPSLPAVVPDGCYTEKTQAAVAAFQRAHALPETGVADLTTWNELVNAYASARMQMAPAEPLRICMKSGQVLEPGCQNSHLYLVQAMLLALRDGCAGIPQVSVTGCHDEASVEAVKWLQARAGLEPTGCVDRLTWLFLVRLYSALAGDGTCGCTLAFGEES